MPRGHYAKRRWKEPRYILPDEHEAILAEIAREKPQSLFRKEKSGAGLELAGGGVASSSSAGPEAPSRNGKPGQ